jgi:uncharacterized protein YukJ
MPIQSYGISKRKAVNKIVASSHHEHFQIFIDATCEMHAIAINVKSQVSPQEVLFYMDHDDHQLCAA